MDKEVNGLKTDIILTEFITKAQKLYAEGKNKEARELAREFYLGQYFQRSNISKAVEEFALSTSGWFLGRDLYQPLKLANPNDHLACQQKLRRLVSDGILEKHKNRNACYRLVEDECEEIEWWKATGETVDVKFPFHIEDYVKIFSGNICVIAGSNNAGKSAFLLDFIRLNLDKHEIHMFNSEAGMAEIKERIGLIEDVDMEEWQTRLKIWERSGEFSAVIKPDAINIIDFLEVHEEFYKVGAYIKDIHDKLDKGIALIALQKNPGNDYGLGGARGLEKPRLYLSIDNGRLKIVKAKNWRTANNPNGWVAKFSLVGGNKFIVHEPLAPQLDKRY